LQRFCELIAAGETQTDAWLKAGYNVSKSVAAANAYETLKKPHIKARVEELRKPQTRQTLSSRDHKRLMLMRTFENPAVKMADRLRALELDAKLAGQFEPDRTEIDVGNRTLQSIRERAETVRSGLIAMYQGQ
jgi:hypothetical protein